MVVGERKKLRGGQNLIWMGERNGMGEGREEEEGLRGGRVGMKGSREGMNGWLDAGMEERARHTCR